MTLYDLTNSMTIQGEFIEIKVFNSEREELKSESFEYVDDLAYQDIGEYEDMKVIFIYSEGFTRYYPNSTKSCASLVIELENGEV